MQLTTQDDEPPFRGRHTPGQRAMLALNVMVIAACFVAATALVLAKRQRENFRAAPTASVVTGADSPGGTGATGDTFPPASADARNFLVVGDDSNPCIDPNSEWASAADPARGRSGQRSDTIMLIRVDPKNKRAAVLSFPRDLWINIPGQAKGRINSTYRKGDYTLMAQSLLDDFGVTVDHYVQVDFCAFKTIVDAVGGVQVPFETASRDTHVHLHIDAVGCHTFHGDEALAYVRSRYYEYQDEKGKWVSDNAYDLGRIARQQDFLRRLLKAASDKGVFTPSVARGLLDTLTKYVVVDRGLSINDMLQFLGILQDVQPKGIPTYQIESKRLVLPNADVLDPQLDSPTMQSILRIFRNQAALADTSSTTPVTPAALVATAPTTHAPTTHAPTATSPSTTADATAPTQDRRGAVPPKDVEC